MRDDEPGAAESAASVRGVRHAFAGAATALDGVDLDLLRGRIGALIGANGAGKTTLLRVLAAVLPPTSGQVAVLGFEQPAAAPERIALSLRARIGYVQQDPALDPEMTGRETLELFCGLYGVPRRERAALAAQQAERFGLAEPLERVVASYSGGLRRRLHLAAGLVHDPELLLLDEPGAGLDPHGSAFLWSELRQRARRGSAVAVVTHDLLAVERHADTVVILERGRVLTSGAPRELIAAHGRTTLSLSADDAATTRAAVERIALEFQAELDAHSDDGRFHFRVAGHEAPQRLLAACAASGLALREVELRVADLASAFASLTGRPFQARTAPEAANRRAAPREA